MSNDSSKELMKYAGRGGAAGLGLFTIVGKAGLVALGGAVSIGAGTFIAGGIVVGAAAYGIIKSMENEK